nr:DUF3046 domain-containing protein [Dermacoccus abyssi]
MANRVRAGESGGVRESEFNRLMLGEFGDAYGPMVASSHVLTDLGGRTANEALAEGVPARRVWEAVCDAFEVPESRRLGEDLPIVERPFD